MNMYQSSLRQFYITQVLNVYKQKTRQKTGFHCSGGWIWTSDLRVM